MKIITDRIVNIDDPSFKKKAQHKIDHKTKPPGALGVLEDIAVRMACIQKTLDPEISSRALFIFAGDHGIAQDGVSAFPAEVTPQMVFNFLSGGAAINVLCRQNNIDIKVVDMGVNFQFASHALLIDKKVAMGTKNFAIMPAMTSKQAKQAIESGADVFMKSHAMKKADITVVGEMGIGNTTSATAVICAVTGVSPADVTGRGTGIDDERLKFKISVIEKALIRHQPDDKNAMDILTKVGGFEIGGMVGAVLAAAANGVPVVLDGLISTAAGLLACQLCPAVIDYLFAGHQSVEAGHRAALAHMNLSPILDLNMRLGEGTGGALAIGIIDAACRIMREMASFEDAGVSGKTE